MKGFRLTGDKLKLSENDVERACLDLLKLRRLYPLRQQSGLFRTPGDSGRYVRIGEPGIPDYVIPRFFLEVKAPGGTLSAVQREKIFQLEKFWDLKTAVPSRIEELIEWLEQHQDEL